MGTLLKRVKSGIFAMHEAIPLDAQHLIRSMLVVDPTKRITVSQSVTRLSLVHRFLCVVCLDGRNNEASVLSPS